jgi:ATP-dependent DNA helicase RecG
MQSVVFSLPVAKALNWLDTNFRLYNPEREIQVSVSRARAQGRPRRLPRGSVANALIHRNYHRMGAAHVRMDDEGPTISNLGSLMDSMTAPRRIRLSVLAWSNAGRCVDKIYRGMLRFGRLELDYRRTDASSCFCGSPQQMWIWPF